MQALQENEDFTSRSLVVNDELEQARRTIRRLEQGQVGSGAPPLTPTLTTQPGGCTSQLTISQPVTALPTSSTRAPWDRGQLREKGCRVRDLHPLLLYFRSKV